MAKSTKKKLLRAMEGKNHDRRPPYARNRCPICGRFTDKAGRCALVDSGYFEPAEHW